MIRFPALPVVLLTVATLTGCQVLQAPVKQPDDSITRQEQSDTAKPDSSTEKAEPSVPPVKPAQSVSIKQSVLQVPVKIDGKLVLGFAEKGTLPDYGLEIDAKIDAGAGRTSIDAINQEFFERDGKKWIRFELNRTSKGAVKLELPLLNTVLVKRPGGTSQERAIVSMSVKVGDITQLLDVSLNDRSKYSYPLLVGRDFLRDMAIADVGKKYIAQKKLLDTVTLTVPNTEKNKVKKTVQKPVNLKGLELLGEMENVTLSGVRGSLKARIDTGAATSSLDAREVETFEKSGTQWVRFKLATPDELVPFELPVARTVLIKQQGNLAAQDRLSVMINTTLGNISKPTEYTLRDRSSYEFPVLIGERFLTGTALVDVARQYIADKPKRGK